MQSTDVRLTPRMEVLLTWVADVSSFARPTSASLAVLRSAAAVHSTCQQNG